MKKFFKTTIIVIVTLITLFFASLEFAPIFVKDYVVDHSEEIIGRKISIGNIDLNPFTFTANVDSFTLFEKDGKNPFIAFEKFRINLDPTKIISKTAAVSEIYMKGLYAQIFQHKDSFNFTDILDFLAKKDSIKTKQTQEALTNPEDSSSIVNAAEMAKKFPFNISVKNIIFEKGNIVYQDTKVGSKFQLQDFSINIPAVYLSNQSTNVGASFKFVDGGDLNVNITANAATNDFQLEIDLKDFDLACGKPYINEFINYKDFKGLLSTHLNIDGNFNKILSSNVRGKVSLNDVELTELSSKKIGVKHIDASIGQVNLEENKFHIQSVVVDGAYAHLDLYKGGKTNIDELLKISSSPKKDSIKTEKKEEKPLNAIIDNLLVQHTSVTANDLSIIKPFHYTVSAVTVKGTSINFNNPCTIDISAEFPEGGSVNVKYNGTLKNPGTMDAYISIKNLALKHFTPYSLHYTGYPLAAGTMAFASENKMKDFNIESQNIIDIYNIDVLDKDDSINPEFTVPMKVGLYILKDKDDKIQFDVPVSGNVKDPEFSYIKIIWKTIMNLLLKVAISPLKIVGNLATTGANAIGFNLGGNDEIYVDVTSTSFTSEQYAKAIKMMEIIVKDPKLELTFTQFYNPQKAVKEYKQHKLKSEFYKKTNGKTTLTELDERAILEISDSDETFKTFADSISANLDVKSMKKELLVFANKRNDELIKVLLQQKGITRKNVKVITAPVGTLNDYSGQAMYKITINVQ